MIAALAGLSAGALHVVGGPDHLAALAPIATRAPRRAVRVGALWGLGHGLGVVAAGSLGRTLRGALDLDALSAGAELAVGLTLVLLGARGLAKAVRAPRDAHPREGATGASALGVGVLHGAAGAGHLFGVLPSLLLSRLGAAAYLGAYLLAAVLTMAAAGALLGRGLSGRSERTRRLAQGAGGAVAALVGVFWIATSV
jgi:hypothetical protein